MRDITSPRLIHLKGWLFLLLGLLSASLLLWEYPTIKVALLLIISLWAFARFYYYLFYVIEHYIDSSYRYSGLRSFIQYWLNLTTKKSQDQ